MAVYLVKPSPFAAVLTDGSVVTWGDPADGGDSSSVQSQLKDVQTIEASGFAFAAILADRSVITWGHGHFGGDSSKVQDQLKDVRAINGSGRAAMQRRCLTAVVSKIN